MPAIEPISSSALLKLAHQHKSATGTILLLSGGEQETAKRSYLFMNPIETLTLYSNRWTLNEKSGSHNNPWDSLKSHIKLSHFGDAPEWAGYLAYEMGAFTEASLPYIEPSIPLAQFFKYEKVYSSPSIPPTRHHTLTPLTSSPNRHYIDLIHKIQNEIKQGDVYQVNLSHELKYPFLKDPFLFFETLFSLNSAPFAAYLKSHEFSLISSSPERLLQKIGHELETRPIKGTAPRGISREEDRMLAANLMHSEKDRAELLMIIDLMRNDLGKVSLPGSVNVNPLIKLETYSNVFHLVSVVRSTANPVFSPVDILRAVFPGGSVTGCPKISAMRSIFHHENRARGIYTGAIGYFTSKGDFDFNIAIRTALHQNNELTFGVGGAIVADSEPEREYQETLHKGRSIIQALNSLSM